VPHGPASPCPLPAACRGAPRWTGPGAARLRQRNAGACPASGSCCARFPGQKMPALAGAVRGSEGRPRHVPGSARVAPLEGDDPRRCGGQVFLPQGRDLGLAGQRSRMTSSVGGPASQIWPVRSVPVVRIRRPSADQAIQVMPPRWPRRLNISAPVSGKAQSLGGPPWPRRLSPRPQTWHTWPGRPPGSSRDGTGRPSD